MFLTKRPGSPYYYIVYFVDGKRTKKSTGSANRGEAEKYLKEFQSQPQHLEEAEKNIEIKISRFEKEYLSYLENNKSKHYIRSVNLSFNQFISQVNDLTLNQISIKTIDKFISAIYSRSPYAARLYYATLKAAFTKAVNWEYLNENPFRKIKAPRLSRKNPVFISDIELNSIVSNTAEQYLKDLFFTAFYTGMRCGELLNMNWNWIDFNQNIITVKCSKSFTTKSKKERIIPMCANLRSMMFNKYSLLMKLSPNEFVFARYPAIKLNEDYVSKKFKKVIRALGMNDDIHFHSLRHSFASLLVQRGVSLYVVKELLGHEDLSTTQIYSHLQVR